MGCIISLNNIEKTYENKKRRFNVFMDFNLSVNKGDLIAVMGRSGVGKSTLLHIIAGLTKINSGSYFFNGKDLAGLSLDKLCRLRISDIGIITQNYLMMEDRKVIDQVMFPLKLKKMPGEESRKTALRMLDNLGIKDKADALPRELSGGETQRAAIARALISNPSVILADEPTSALDLSTEREIMNIMLDLNAKGKTIIIATHDPDIARLCQRTVSL